MMLKNIFTDWEESTLLLVVSFAKNIPEICSFHRFKKPENVLTQTAQQQNLANASQSIVVKLRTSVLLALLLRNHVCIVA